MSERPFVLPGSAPLTVFCFLLVRGQTNQGVRIFFFLSPLL